MGLNVNGVNHNYSNFTVPPGQTRDEFFTLPKLVITSASAHDTPKEIITANSSSF
jgi:hypothetical protein